MGEHTDMVRDFEVERVAACRTRSDLVIARAELPDAPHIHEAARNLIREKGWTCFPCGTSRSDWTDWTLTRIGWKLDEDRRGGRKLLTDWQRVICFRILKTARKQGASYQIPADQMKAVREILSARSGDSEALIDDE